MKLLLIFLLSIVLMSGFVNADYDLLGEKGVTSEVLCNEIELTDDDWKEYCGPVQVEPVQICANCVEPMPKCEEDGQYRCRPQIDVVFVIDTTGSMADEIRTVKTHIKKIVNEVSEGNPRPSLRVGIVAYRDHKDEEREYLVKRHDLTLDIQGVTQYLMDIEAAGGGDYPEAVADGLYVGLNKMSWDQNSRKVIFLIGDAPPHGFGVDEYSYRQGCPEGHSYKDAIETANQKGVRIYTISGSGMNTVGVRVWKDIAAETGGQYERLSYQRVDVDQYYEEQGIEEYVGLAKKSADYDAGSNTILENTLGVFTKKAFMQEAVAAGVRYEEPVDDWNDEEEVEIELYDDGIDYGSIVGDDSDEVLVDDSEGIDYTAISGDEESDEVLVESDDSGSTLQKFLRTVFARLVFWD